MLPPNLPEKNPAFPFFFQQSPTHVSLEIETTVSSNCVIKTISPFPVPTPFVPVPTYTSFASTNILLLLSMNEHILIIHTYGLSRPAKCAINTSSIKVEDLLGLVIRSMAMSACCTLVEYVARQVGDRERVHRTCERSFVVPLCLWYGPSSTGRSTATVLPRGGSVSTRTRTTYKP